jgi:N6-adenosine-specific RNA methylase IME4
MGTPPAVTKSHVPSIPKALHALSLMEAELDSARTYESIRRIIDAAEAMKILLRGVVEVKQQAEWVVLLGNMRIGEEIGKVQKGRGPGGVKGTTAFPPEGKSSGREALGIAHTPRARLQKLARAGRKKLEIVAKALWKAGKDATIKGVLGEVKETEIKDKRAAFEARRDRGARVSDLAAMIEQGLRFPVIYADPPWEFKVYSGKGKQRSAERHYDTASLEAIKALPIASLAADNCALFMWGVWPELPGALEVIKAWGFEYKTAAFVWFKEVSAENSDFATGMGYWTRANTEPCFLATRGAPERVNKDVHQIIRAPVGEHSVKPEETRARIERLITGPYLELFARRPVAGWTVWGNEVDVADTAEAAE